MKYAKVIPARFIRRPNRFIAYVDVGGREEIVHVKNTGRCRELLVPGCTVYLSCPERVPETRKTSYDLIGVRKERPGKPPLSVNMDSQIANDVLGEWLPRSGLLSPAGVLRREVTYGASRFDFYIEDGSRRLFLEVKSVTLERDGIALFPDAPTERGVKHIRELMACIRDGYEAYLVFVIQMNGIRSFRPNDETHRAFGDALREAAAAGVRILAMDCIVTEKSIQIHKAVPVELETGNRGIEKRVE